MQDQDEIRTLGPGKFSTVLDRYIYNVSLDGGCDDEVSAFDQWYGVMYDGMSIFRDHDPFCEEFNDAEREMLQDSAGAILFENSQGFVYVDLYETRQEIESAWSGILESLAEDGAFDDVEG
jgi:hypothetical protein